MARMDGENRLWRPNPRRDTGQAVLPDGSIAPGGTSAEYSIMAETRYGALEIPAGRDDLIGRFLLETGEWAFDEASFVAGFAPEGGRVLDAGAFVGTFGLGLAVLRPIGFLCAVEANPKVLPLLEANLRRNAKIPVEVVGGLLGGPGTVPWPGRADPNNAGSASFAKAATGAVALSGPGNHSDAPGTARTPRRVRHHQTRR